MLGTRVTPALMWRVRGHASAGSLLNASPRTVATGPIAWPLDNEDPILGSDRSVRDEELSKREIWLDLSGAVERESTVVFADGWPEWLPVLPALGFRCSTVYCGGDAGRHQCWFGDDVSWWLASGRASWKRLRLSGPRLAFISGSIDFVEAIMWKHREQPFCATVTGSWQCSKLWRRLPQFSWHSLRHSACGGVTSGQYWLGVPCRNVSKFTPRACVSPRL